MAGFTTLIAFALAAALVGRDVAAQGHTGYHNPRWSPDGRSILTVSMSSSGSRVVIIPVDGGPAVQVPTKTLQPMAADWTRAGRISFLADSSGVMRRYVVDRDGRNLRSSPLDSVMAATPDSSVLLYERHVGQGSDIVSMNRTRSSARQLTSRVWAEQPSISPDGRTILFERRADPNDMAASDVVTMGLDGSNQQAIARGTDPSWSPDGKTVLFKALERDELWLTIVDVATKRQRRLVRGVHPQWSPDGTRIVYMQDTRDAAGEIYIVGQDGTGNRCLTCAPGGRSSSPHR